jgi:hypothetical protein
LIERKVFLTKKFNFSEEVELLGRPLLHLSRYIHRNPVTAGLVTHPADWQFSIAEKFNFSEDRKVQLLGRS